LPTAQWAGFLSGAVRKSPACRVHPILFHFGFVVVPAYGVLAAAGVLCALLLGQLMARATGLDPAKIWNLSIAILVAALSVERVLLVAVNWRDVYAHPSWLFALSMVHHPLLAAVGAAAAAAAGAFFAVRWKLPPRVTADALAVPLAVGLACEQCGALLAGSDYGLPAGAGWSITYTSPFAAQWSGAPLGVAVHPVQAYAAVALLLVAVFLFFWLPERKRNGDVAGVFLVATGVIVFFTEFLRDPVGRGSIFAGSVDGPQIVAVLLVVGGGALLMDLKRIAKAGEPLGTRKTIPSEGLRPARYDQGSTTSEAESRGQRGPWIN
jgi:phosphatidylglycerol:prolipoprotein diacylglycerol transferase